MARWATFVEVAGVSFTGCRVELINAGGFKSPNVGSTDYGNDGTPSIQTVNRGVKGVHFGLRFQSTKIDALTTMLTAIAAAEATQSTFEVAVIDGLFDIDVLATVDYEQDWFQYGTQSEGYYENVTLLFIAKSEA